MKKVIRYCSHCGEKITGELIGAETKFIYSYSGNTRVPFAPRYDDKTGKRQYVMSFVCPKWKKRWFTRPSLHEKYYIKEIITK